MPNTIEEQKSESVVKREACPMILGEQLENPFSVNKFLKPYLSMFRELQAIGCTFVNMESSICTYSISAFRDNLISHHPNLKEQITTIISSRL